MPALSRPALDYAGRTSGGWGNGSPQAFGALQSRFESESPSRMALPARGGRSPGPAGMPAPGAEPPDPTVPRSPVAQVGWPGAPVASPRACGRQYSGGMTAAPEYGELHRLVDRLTPD